MYVFVLYQVDHVLSQFVSDFIMTSVRSFGGWGEKNNRNVHSAHVCLLNRAYTWVWGVYWEIGNTGLTAPTQQNFFYFHSKPSVRTIYYMYIY